MKPKHEQSAVGAALPELASAPARAPELHDLFRLHHTSLSRLSARWARGNHADAQDLLAEAYVRALHAIECGRVPGNPVAWLSTIIANLARDNLRARSRTTRSFEAGDAELELLCATDSESDTRFVTRELLSVTIEKVQELAPTQQRALLARSAGEEYAAIAAQLGISPANARKLVQTARSALRARLSLHE